MLQCIVSLLITKFAIIRFDRGCCYRYNDSMKEWQLSDSDPLHLTLAADARLGSVDYLDDHIWEIELNGGTPPALSVWTTYGLRARLARFFPRFSKQEEWLSDPQQFTLAPTVSRLFPNLIAVKYAPFNGVNVLAEYWAPESHVLAGRLTFSNTGISTVSFPFEWVGFLSPLGDGYGMTIKEQHHRYFLEGKTGNLYPVCILSGDPQPGIEPYAGLAHEVKLKPGRSTQLMWATAALEEPQRSFELALQTINRPWEAEIARIELLAESQTVEITTGSTDWDAVLAFSQRAASALFFPGNDHLRYPSFVLARQPENGYSLRGDGLDYNHLWDGQTVLDAWYLNNLVCPGQAERMAGVVENFIQVQQNDGSIDWKPGLSGQRSKRLAQPMLAELAWNIYSVLEDRAWIERIFPALFNFYHCWFNAQSDRDQDGYPEWDHPFQSGFDEAPLFHPWHSYGQGVDPDVVESPSLAAMLYREGEGLHQIATLLGHTDQAAWLVDAREKLRQELNHNWDGERGTYRYRDAQTQDSPAGQHLMSAGIAGTYPVLQSFSSPRRLIIRKRAPEDSTHTAHLLVSGETPEGMVTEEISPRDFHWLHGTGRYTSRHQFTCVTEVVIRAMQPGEHCDVSTVDFSCEDLSLLLPLWAGVPDSEQAEAILKNALFSRYLTPFGFSILPLDHNQTETQAGGVSPLWNTLICEGLLRYGYRIEAAQVMTALIHTISANMKQTHAFWSLYDIESGKGKGEPNTLAGLAPVGLFLQVLGLKEISFSRVIVEGLNPFLLPVTVKYQGTNVVFFSEYTQITFAGGQSAIVQDQNRHEITLQ